MPAKRLSMRKIREVLRLKWAAGMSNRRIAASCGVSRPTVSEYLRRAEAAGLSWPLPAEPGSWAVAGLCRVHRDIGPGGRRRSTYRRLTTLPPEMPCSVSE